MAQQSSFYNTDGTTRTYPSSKHIASKQHVAVYFQSVTTSTWSVIEQTLYDLVNNSIVFTDAPDSALYSKIEIRVADTAAELTDSPSDIATVAGSIANVNTVAGAITSVETVSTNIASVSTVSGAIANVNAVGGSIANVNTVATSITNVNTVAANVADVVSVANTIVPNIAEILLADTNAATATTQAGIATTKAGEASTSATNAQLRAWEAEAERLTADSYATEAEDVFVKIYTSDGDGTFTATNTTEYSALHWRNKAAIIAVGQASNISFTPTGDISSTNVQSALAELDTEKISESNIHNATSKVTPVNADELALLDSTTSFSLKKLTWANVKATIFSSPALTGTPTAPTPSAGDNDTSIATTAFVQGEITGKPAFSAYRSGTTQTVSNATATKVQFNSEEFDTTNAYDNSTNFRFTPQKAGRYRVNAAIYFQTLTTDTSQLILYKNGSSYKKGASVKSNVYSTSVDCLVDLNGSTDYIEIYVVHTGGTGVYFGSDLSYFQAHLIMGV